MITVGEFFSKVVTKEGEQFDNTGKATFNHSRVTAWKVSEKTAPHCVFQMLKVILEKGFLLTMGT